MTHFDLDLRQGKYTNAQKCHKDSGSVFPKSFGTRNKLIARLIQANVLLDDNELQANGLQDPNLQNIDLQGADSERAVVLLRRFTMRSFSMQ